MSSDVKILESVLIPISDIQPNDWNPNEQSEAIFLGLVEEIRSDGFGNPLGVVPLESDVGGVPPCRQYRIVEGEHRYRAAIQLGMVAVPCFVYEDWDETTQRLKSVRRNLLTGSIDSTKFTALVRSLDGSIDTELLPDLLGFESRDQFERYLLPEFFESESTDELLGTEPEESSSSERAARDSIADIVTSLFLDSCDTIDQDYLVFSYRGASISVILCHDNLADSLAAFTKGIRDNGLSAADEFEKLLDVWVASNSD